MKTGIVLDDDVGRRRVGFSQYLHENAAAAAPGRSTDVCEQVVLDQHPLGGLADGEIIGAGHIEPGGHVLQDVHPHGHIGDLHVLPTHREQYAKTDLRHWPTMLQQIAFD